MSNNWDGNQDYWEWTYTTGSGLREPITLTNDENQTLLMFTHQEGLRLSAVLNETRLIDLGFLHHTVFGRYRVTERGMAYLKWKGLL